MDFINTNAYIVCMVRITLLKCIVILVHFIAIDYHKFLKGLFLLRYYNKILLMNYRINKL